MLQLRYIILSKQFSKVIFPLKNITILWIEKREKRVQCTQLAILPYNSKKLQMLVVVELQYWKVCIAKYKIFFFVKSNFTNIFGKDIFFLALWFWNDLVGKNSNIRRLNLTYVTPILSMISDFTDFFQYRIFLLPRCTAIHPVFLCTVCSIINSSSRQHKTLTPWPDAFSRKISFYFFSCN